eukprot:TRINITY_DN611_c0_g2_i6.p2 TRINITY_DN611_c0_g2~~TRINITY_DN611_c0_g2_i6.p2  ORF type:complete len:105 (-),score=8.41 TRINITY_DN611_c0_g2_i6:1102-1416(-)
MIAHALTVSATHGQGRRSSTTLAEQCALTDVIEQATSIYHDISTTLTILTRIVHKHTVGAVQYPPAFLVDGTTVVLSCIVCKQAVGAVQCPIKFQVDGTTILFS